MSQVNKFLNVLASEAGNCANCGHHPNAKILLQYKWIDIQLRLITTCPACHDRVTRKDEAIPHVEYRIALKKKAEGNKLSMWDRRIIGAYESWRDHSAQWDFLFQVAQEIRKAKDEWKKSKGY